MNAKKPALDAKGVSKISLSKSVLWKMAYGEKSTRRTCPVCEKIKNPDDLVCDKCIGRYGNELNIVIHNALCEICPERYQQKRSVTIEFEIVDGRPAVKKLETPTEIKVEESSVEMPCQDIPKNISGENNLLEIVPGFYLYEDEIRKMANREPGVEVNCPICKSPKGNENWMCFSCAEERRSFMFKRNLIQYSIIRLPAHVSFVDGIICEQETEEILLRFAVKVLSSPARDLFAKKPRYLRTLLRYSPDLESWRLPVASCIVSKVVFHAFAIVDGKPWFKGAPSSNPGEIITQPIIATEIIPQDAAEAIIKLTEPAVPIPVKILTRESFSREASEMFAGISENLNENLRTGESLAAFLSQKVLEWKEATGKKNPDTREFFAKVPFSEKFLEQLKQSGNCSLKFFTELAEYFTMSGEEILAEGLLTQSQKENLQKSSLSETDLEKNNQEKIVVDDSTEVVDKKTNPEEQLADDEEIVFVKLAESLLGKIQKNLREAPPVAKALWAFINETAKEKRMTIVDFGKTIGIYTSSLCALKIGGNKQQCLSVSKFKEVVARMGLSKEIIIARGLELLVKEGDTSARNEFLAIKNSGEPEKVAESLKN
ncbi:MAG: hypothetical protein UR66_C0004G0041 [Candidatus Moranbacteria bacterium GW2011_GWE1_35_17]|nr:MAG: hypothetical protein UR66_C0004G0041 [Candidatus Moranbacteria bacterium GW2011_GWE1_35_17]KKP72855.1 MAG: hypothetical protein UR65_C0011G0005 [Candidatus Moranbacteria bacterium GW2011_GWE2_35_164]KKP84076.1 MAG: hypothetical protein UR82_C0013G0003 [Candidatus Moranbacteria bacterium GW2011_GWF1_35_5]KKP85114.1 MAG: hypothetical protein UR83_C0004G0002 [Candidatus Moranbacteria bacterium GW2011_GWF2_35_54]